MRLPNNLNSFTLIEVLIVVGIMGILTMSALPAFGTFADRRAFQNNVDVFSEKVRSVRSKAMSGVLASNKEVNWYLEATNSGTTYKIGSIMIASPYTDAFITESLSGSGISFDCTECRLVFQRLTGKRTSGSAGSSQNITVNYSKNGDTLSKVIKVYESGKIETQ